MREPESRRGVPLRAGIGLATVAATVAAGIALANPASAVGEYNVTESLGATSVQSNIYNAVTGKVTDNTGTGIATDPLSITVTETATSNPGITIANSTGTAQAATVTNSGTTWTATSTALSTAVDGTYSFKVTAQTAGTVNVAVKAGTISAIAQNFTVTGGLDGAANVSKIGGVPTSPVTQYVTGTDGNLTFKPIPEDSNGNGVTGVNGAVYYSVSGSTTIAATACTPPAGTDTPADVLSSQSYAFGCNLAGLGATAGTDTITYWVDKSGGTGGVLDSGEPSATVTATFVAEPTFTSDVVTSKLTATNQIQTGKATTIPFTLTLLNGTTPVVGAMVRMDISGTAGLTGTVAGKTDSNGQLTTNVSVTAAQAVLNNTIIVTPFVSGVNSAGAGDNTGQTADTVTVKDPAIAVTLNAQSPIQAVDGGTVSIPVKVADQFGNSYAGDALAYAVALGGRNANKGGSAGTVGADGTATVTYTDTGLSGTSDSVTVTDTTRSINSAAIPVNYIASLTPASITWVTKTTNMSKAVSNETNGDVYTVQVENSATTPLTNQKVTFSVDNGFVAAGSSATGTSSVTVVTNSLGEATVYTGSEKVGTQTLTASVGSLTPINTDSGTPTTAPIIKYVAGAPVKTVVSGPTNVQPGNSVTYTATITDQFGNAVAPGLGIGVDWTKTGPGTFSTATSTPTDANGQATVVLATASNDNGSGTVTATSKTKDLSLTALPAGSVNYTVANPTPTTVTVTPTSGVKAGGTETVTAKVVDQFGNPSANVTVVFSVSGANTVSGSAMTGVGGVAAFTYKAAKAGTDTIKATAAGSVSGSAKVTIVAPPAKKVETPRLSGKSYSAGTAKVYVTTSPKIAKGSVVIYRWTGKKWVKAATVKTGTGGKASVVIKHLKKGGKVSFKAIATSKSYTEHYSNVAKVKIKK